MTVTFLAESGSVVMYYGSRVEVLSPESVERRLAMFRRWNDDELWCALWCAREALRLQPVICGSVDGFAVMRGDERCEFPTLDKALLASRELAPSTFAKLESATQ